MTESWAKRKINVRIVANKGRDDEQELFFEGLKCSVRTTIYSGTIQAELNLSIWGMSLEHMNSLTVFGPIMGERRTNEITVTAGEEGSLMPTVYSGVFWQAYADMNGSPEVVFRIVALSAAQNQLNVVDARNHKGPANAAVIMEDLAKEMGYKFENNGVSVMLRDRTYSGTALIQARECADDANINFSIERGVLAIWPKASKRKPDSILISPETGMVGYPTFAGNGVVVTTLFNPDIMLGVPVEIKSSMQVACGTWTVTHVTCLLESETPNGAWYTQVSTYGKAPN